MNGKVERFLPLISGTVGASLYLLLLRGYVAPASATDLLAAIVSISGISVGFLAQTKATLVSMDQKRIIGQLRALGLYTRLIDYLMSAVFWNFLLAIVSAVALVVRLPEVSGWRTAAVAGGLFVFMAAIAAYYRIFRIFGKILRSTDGDEAGAANISLSSQP